VAASDLVPAGPTLILAAPSPYRTLAEILADPKILEPPETVVPRLAWRGRVTLLAAREKDGKSTLAGAAAAAVTCGTPFLDGIALHGVVVIAGLEEHPGEIARRLVGFKADPRMVHIATYTEVSPVIELEMAVGQIRPALVIVDTLSAIAEGKLEDGSAKAWQPLMAALTKLARGYDCAVIIVHHARKSDGAYRDSSAIGANVDCIIEMRSDERDPNARNLKARGRFPVPDCAIRYNGTGFEMADTAEPTVALRNSILEYVNKHPGCPLGKLRDGVVGSSAKVGSVVDELVSEGVLREEKGERGARLFYPAHPAYPAGTLIQP
jgi:AAA domain